MKTTNGDGKKLTSARAKKQKKVDVIDQSEKPDKAKYSRLPESEEQEIVALLNQGLPIEKIVRKKPHWNITRVFFATFYNKA